MKITHKKLKRIIIEEIGRLQETGLGDKAPATVKDFISLLNSNGYKAKITGRGPGKYKVSFEKSGKEGDVWDAEFWMQTDPA